MLRMVLDLLLAWLVLSVVFAALFSLLARRIGRNDRDWDRELRELLARGTDPVPLATAVTSRPSGGARRRRAPSPRRGPEGMAESRG